MSALLPDETALSPGEFTLCDMNLIEDGLDAFRNRFRAKGYSSNDRWDEIVRSGGDTVRQLISSLQGLAAAALLPSRHSTGKLNLDLATTVFPLVDRGLNVEKTAVLLERVVKSEPDGNIWCAVYALVASAIPATPARDDTSSAVQQTPLVASSGTIHNADETRKQMDALIKDEMSDSMYFDVPDFVDRIFHSIPGLQSLAEDVFRRYTDPHTIRREPFPLDHKEEKVIKWFMGELRSLIALVSSSEKVPKEMDPTTLTSRSLVAMPELTLEGTVAKRKMDIGFASRTSTSTSTGRCNWADVLVAGELKSNTDNAGRANTTYDLGRYVREIYESQDTRRFVHGFTVCGAVMTVWMFDRGAVYSAPAFRVDMDGLKFVTVMLGYLLMSATRLGLDPTVVRDGNQRYMRFGDERFCLVERIHRSGGLICRGTTCWKASLNGKSYVIKDSWQYDGREDEGELLAKAWDAGVQHIPRCYLHNTVRVGDTEDDDTEDNIFQVRNGMDIQAGKKYRLRHTSSSWTSRTTVTSTASSLGKRVASASLDERQLKRTRSESTTQTGIQVKPLENRRHKRIVMGPIEPGKIGKKLNLARARVGLLKAVMDGISGIWDLYRKAGLLYRDVSIGNILISEDEEEGMVIDLDQAVRIDRSKASGVTGRTGTKVFMSIGVLRDTRPQTYMDDLESIFWLLFWICIHYSGPEDKKGRKTEYDKWNFKPAEELGDIKAGRIRDDALFLERAEAEFTDYYRPLAPWINRLRREVFPNNQAWKKEDEGLFDRMKDVLRRAMENREVRAAWPPQSELEKPAMQVSNPRYHTRRRATNQ